MAFLSFRHARRRHLCGLAFALGWLPQVLPAQLAPVGIPLLRTFSRNDFSGTQVQCWAAAQSPRGLIYVAGTSGLLEYDGAQWRVLEPNRTEVRGVAVDEEGTLYVADRGDVGRMVVQPDGSLAFSSLLDQLPEPARQFGTVWDLFAVGKNIYFNTGSTLVRYGPQGAQVWQAQQPDGFHLAFKVGTEIYVREWGVGLQRLDETSGQLALVPGGEQWAQVRIDALLPLGSGKMLAASRQAGLFSYDGTAFSEIEGPLADFLRRYRVSGGIPITGGRFAFATLDSGMVVADASLKPLMHLEAETGLLSHNVRGLMQDRDGHLWLTHDAGVTHLEYPSPITVWDARRGLRGKVEATAWYKGTLYAGTSAGLYRLKPGRDPLAMPVFEPVTGLRGQVWHLLATPQALLVASSLGIYQLTADKATPVATGALPRPAFYLDHLPGSPATVWVAQSNGIAQLKLKGAAYVYDQILPGLEQEMRWVLAESPGRLWCGNSLQGVWRLSALGGQPPAALGEEAGLPTAPGTRMFRVKDRTVCATRNGMYAYDEASAAFKPDAALTGLYEAGQAGVGYLDAAPTGDIWVYGGPQGQFALRLLVPDPTQQYVQRPLPDRRLLGTSISRFSAGPPGQVLISTDKGLYVLNQPEPSAFERSFPTLVRGVVAGADSLVFFGALPPGALPSDPAWTPVLEFASNNVQFSFGAVNYAGAEALRYQYWLKPFQKDWSTPTARPDVLFTNLPEGDYSLRVKATNVYGVVGEEAQYYFRILPPWYRTLWAFLGYGAGGILLVLGFVQWRIAALQREKRRLEGIVIERTAEVVRQKDELAVVNAEITEKNAELENAYEEIRAQNENLEAANHIIEEKNQDIMDSIQYAQRIQEAFLPRAEVLARAFPEHLVLFKPRDIVSGDFYWYAELPGQRHLFVCADCTGHGVPGGFMSMMGNSLLNQLVLERGMTDPAAIITELDRKVQETLRQKEKGARSKDGMEASLLLFDFSQRTLYYSGANRPLVLIRGGELLDYEPVKRPIGGSPIEYEEGFVTHAIPWHAYDVFYTYSDGYGDQFGGDRGKKFMTGKMKKLFQEIHQQPMEAQHALLDQTIEEWKAGREQVDDILVAAFRMS